MAVKEAYTGGKVVICGQAENSAYGVDGNDPSLQAMASAYRFPPDWKCTFENVVKHAPRGKIGLQGEEVAPVVTGWDIAGGIEGSLHSRSVPVLTALAIAMGLEKVDADGTHYFRFGENVINSDETDFSGSAYRHMRIDENFDDKTLRQFVGCKFGTCTITITPRELTTIVLGGLAYKENTVAAPTTSGSFTGNYPINTLFKGETALCYMREFATSGDIGDSDKVRLRTMPIATDHAMEAVANTGTGLYTEEPIGNPEAKSATSVVEMKFGETDDYEGRRDWFAAFNADTKIQLYYKDTNAAGDTFEFFGPCGVITKATAIPGDAGIIGAIYEIKWVSANETLTGTFADLGFTRCECRVKNNYGGANYMNG